MPHVKSTLHTFLIHHFACIKFHFPLKNFHFPHKTFYFPTNISFPLLKTLSFSLYLSHPLSLSLTHTHRSWYSHSHSHTQLRRRRRGETSPPTSHTHRRPISSAAEPNADKAGSRGFRWWKAYVHEIVGGGRRSSSVVVKPVTMWRSQGATLTGQIQQEVRFTNVYVLLC